MDILYEDNHIIVAYKESGILSQEDNSKDSDMLTLIKDYIKEKYHKPGNVFLGLVHRLDRNTSGVMVFAKTSKAASRLSEAIKEHSFKKSYLAIVHGKMDITNEFVTLKNNLLKDEEQNKSFVSNSPKAKEAILEYKVLATKNNLSLVVINLLTGRHHQIRAQFSHINHPLYGDVKYGSKEEIGNKYALCAYKLSFPHPTTKETLCFKMIKEDIFDVFDKDIINNYKL